MEPSPRTVPVVVAVTVAVLSVAVLWWALARADGGPVNPQGPITTTTQAAPGEQPSGTAALTAAPFKLRYERSGPAATATVDATVDVGSSSAMFVSPDATVLVVNGVRYTQVPSSVAGQLPPSAKWIRHSAPVDALDLAELFPVEVSTDTSTANLLAFTTLPGTQISADGDVRRFRLELAGVTDTEPPRAAVTWELGPADELRGLAAVTGVEGGEDRVTITVSGYGEPSGLTAPDPATVIDETQLPPAVAALI